MSITEQSYVAGERVDAVVLQWIGHVTALYNVLEFHLIVL